MSAAISWFFEHEDEGIILEDDCVPHPSFFVYCETLLEKYRQDERIWCISGSNFQAGQWRGDGSYYFSHYSHCWGWASWRRCWKHYDADLSLWPRLRDSGLLQTVFPDTEQRQYWTNIWQRLYDENEPDSWSYCWTLTCIAMGGLTALPNYNIVSNIGFGPDATHTTSSQSFQAPKYGLKDIVHPSFILPDLDADLYTFNHHFGGSYMNYRDSIRGMLLDPFLARLHRLVLHPLHYPKKLFRILRNKLAKN